MTLGFSSRLSNETLSTLVSGGPPTLMESTLAPFGLTLKGVQVSS